MRPFLLTLLLASSATAQTFGPAFLADYTFTDLGSPGMVPGPLGGIHFDPNDSNVVWVGGSANNAGGAIFAVPVTRDAQGHITAFAGPGTQIILAPNIDGGIAFAPNGVMFVTTFANNRLLQYRPGSTSPDKDTDLSALGVTSSVGTCQFVPAGFAGAGIFKIGSFSASTWYDMTLVPDAQGTFDVNAATATVFTGGGPEGIVYIQDGNPGFAVDSVLISEFSLGQVSAYDIDGNGDPVPTSRRPFLDGLGGAEGAVIDPVTGDFLFSTFGGGDRVLVVQGFSAPTIFCNGLANSLGCVPAITFTGSPTLTGPDDFVVRSDQMLNQSFGILFASTTPDAVPFGLGTLCLGGTILRLPVQFSGGLLAPPGTDCSGTYSHPLSQLWFNQNNLTAGTTVYLQYLARDSGFVNPNSLSVSSGLRFTLAP